MTNNRVFQKCCRHRDFELLIDRLSALASVCSQIQLSLVNLKNIRLSPSDKKDITIDLYLLKNCYKRRKVRINYLYGFLSSTYYCCTPKYNLMASDGFSIGGIYWRVALWQGYFHCPYQIYQLTNVRVSRTAEQPSLEQTLSVFCVSQARSSQSCLQGGTSPTRKNCH